MRAAYLVYARPGDKAAREKCMDSIRPLNPATTYLVAGMDMKDAVNKIAQDSRPDIIFFNEIGVVNSGDYFYAAMDAVENGAMLGCASWEYESSPNISTKIFSRMIQYGCNSASSKGIMHNNGFISTRILGMLNGIPSGDKPLSELSYKALTFNIPFAYLKDECHLIPLEESLKENPMSFWLDTALPNARETMKSYFRRS